MKAQSRVYGLGQGWALIPTMGTLQSMISHQAYNTSCDLNERKNYLQVSGSGVLLFYKYPDAQVSPFPGI